MSINFLSNLVKPKSKDEDSRRREFILNVILLSSILLIIIADIIALLDFIKNNYSTKGVPLEILFLILIIFIILYIFSRSGFIKISSYLLLLTYFIPTTYTLYAYGIQLPTPLLAYALIIVISGILINIKCNFTTASLMAITVYTLSYLQINGITNPDLYWQDDIIKIGDNIVYICILFIIAIVSCLYNNELEKSLRRCHESETALKKERDFLEIKVKERTDELEIAQKEKISQLSLFAEFGRISSETIHNLINPLTSISLNLEEIKTKNNKKLLGDAKLYLTQAINATNYLKKFLLTIRKQIINNDYKTIILLDDEIKQATKLISHRAHKAEIDIVFLPKNNISTYGNSIKFSQLVTNLVSNAVDAYHNMPFNEKIKRKIEIKLYEKDDSIYLSVQDWGCGIPQNILNKIFDQFFTTKGQSGCTGIGLATCKKIVKQNLKGRIKVGSQIDKGTIFIVWFPKAT